MVMQSSIHSGRIQHHLRCQSHPVLAPAALPHLLTLHQQQHPQHPTPLGVPQQLGQQSHQQLCRRQRLVCRQQNAGAAAAAEPPGGQGEVMGKQHGSWRIVSVPAWPVGASSCYKV